MYVNVITVFVVFKIAQCWTLPFEGLYRLDIIHYNDFHARFEETSVATPTCRYNNNSCLGGFPRLYHEIQVLREEKPASIIVNAGDSFQGTYWYTLLKWNITQEFMNMIPHDAHAVGNHEFDDGPENLAKYIEHLEAPVLAANIDVSQEPSLKHLFKSSLVVERKGRRIGIFGVTTVDTKKLSNPGKVVFTDPFMAAQLEAEKMTARGVDITILLSHCGLDVDKQIAKHYGKDIDIVIGGHTHSLLWNSSPSPSGEEIAGTYPVFIQPTEDEKHQVLIVQASAFTKYMGNLSVNFDIRGDYVSWEGGPIFLDRSIPEDEKIKEKLAPYAEKVHAAENVPLGSSLTTLRSEDCVFGECAIGDFLCDAQNEFGKEKVRSDLDFISFMQRGNIKSSILAGNITHGTLFELLPYNDRVESFELQGTHVLEALERSVLDAWAYDPFKGPWVLQFSGLQVTFDMSELEGQRVTSALVGDKNSTKALDKEAYYQVIAPSFLADGGDGYTMFKTGKRNMQVIGRDQAVVEAYIRKHSPLDVTTDGRITIIQKQ